ncbi:7378_t:CDS:1 [Paraglomus brasilianum]|uniref:7378_t:CDS:1 n=1 Tax=Paraglomus brasilianum TaxID=144538 RepID=A0A9N9DJU5_9GLOM|nr:7378_t:CDS:1 [Paraglomus brasilianum]
MKILTLILVLAAVILASATTSQLQGRSDIQYSQLQRRSPCDSGYYECTDGEGECCPTGEKCLPGHKCSAGSDSPSGRSGINGRNSDGTENGGSGTNSGGRSLFSSTLSIELLTTTIVILLYMFGHM